jgi:low affinity Fe/Cu permease
MRDRFNQVASGVTARLGSPYALVAAVGIIVIWAVSGPFFGFSETWQLIINTGTTIITFLMVFVIQASQNRDSKALHLKLDEVIRAVEGARNELIGAESSTEEEIAAKEEEFLRIAAEGARAGATDEHAPATADHVERHAKRDPQVRAAARDAAERAVAGKGASRNGSQRTRRATAAKPVRGH